MDRYLHDVEGTAIEVGSKIAVPGFRNGRATLRIGRVLWFDVDKELVRVDWTWGTEPWDLPRMPTNVDLANTRVIVVS